MSLRKKKKKGNHNRRHHWTDDEEAVLQVIFKQSLSAKKLPKLNEISKNIKAHGDFSYILERVSSSAIKNKISRMMHK